MILICDHRGRGLIQALRPLKGVGFEVEATSSLRETRERLHAGGPLLLIVDPLAGGASLELEALAEQAAAPPGLPMLVVVDPTVAGSLPRTAENFPGDLWDVIRRDAPLEEYALRVQKLLARRLELSELGDLRYRASHDDLTELLRPLVFQARLEEHFSAAQRHELNLTLVLIDLDHFGQVNKTFDHTVGDRVLSCTAQVIRESLRAEDVAGRLGGDEFALCLPFTDAMKAAATVRRLCDTIRGLSGTVEGTSRHLPVSASLGFETTSGGEVGSVESLRRHAEAALRSAKRAGGDRAVWYRTIDH